MSEFNQHKSPKICILGATFNTANMGVSMLAAGAIRCVLHRFPHADIMLLDYARKGYDFDFPHNDRLIPIRFVNIRFSKKVYLANNIALLLLLALVSRLIPSETLRTHLLSRNRYMKEVLESDIVFSLSGGDSFSDIYGLGRFLYVSLPQLLALFAGKRLICLPQTIGPFRSRLVQRIAKYILKHAEVVYSRDHDGLNVTRRLLGSGGSNCRLRFCYDLAFDVDPAPPASLDIEGLSDLRNNPSPVVGFNISGLLLAGGYNQDNMFGLRVNYDKLVHKLIEFLIEEKSATVLLIPHVFGARGELESDTDACEKVFESLRSRYEGKIGLARGTYRHDEVKHVIGLCDFFVGARMHACIGAISQNIPTVPIAYSDKFVGMMQAIGFGDLVVDPRRMDVGEIIQILNRVYEQRRFVRAACEKRIPEVKQAIRTALGGVAV